MNVAVPEPFLLSVVVPDIIKLPKDLHVGEDGGITGGVVGHVSTPPFVVVDVYVDPSPVHDLAPDNPGDRVAPPPPSDEPDGHEKVHVPVL